MLQAQTLPYATPPIEQIHPFSKMAVTFEPLHWRDFDDLWDLESLITWSAISNRWGVAAPYREEKAGWLT